MSSYWYLASPYSEYPGGWEKAHTEVCRAATKLLEAGVNVFCPIAHGHHFFGGPPGSEGSTNRPDDYEFWMGLDEVFMDGAIGCIVLQMAEWEISLGIMMEIEYFTKLGKPILFMNWKEDLS